MTGPSPSRDRILFASLASFLLHSSWAAVDLNRIVDFHIPAQPLDMALLEFSKQAHVQLAVNASSLKKIKSPKIDGPLVASAALSELLLHSGLEYNTIGSTVTVAPIARPYLLSTDQQKRPPESGSGQRLAAVAPGPAAKNGQLDGNTPTGPAVTEEVVVTAQKREERLIDTPQSVSVLSSATINKLAAVQLRDFADTVPGLTLTTAGAGFNQISLRGVTSGVDISSTVGIYVDDVPFGSSSSFAHGSHLGLDVGLFDLDRIEVLRGPQGTLYGASTMGGLIKYVTKQPDPNGFGGDAQAGVSGTDNGGTNYNVAGAANIPLSNTVAIRVSGFESHDGGYIDNVARGQKDVNSSDIYGGRIDLLVNPCDELTVRLVAFLQAISRDGQATADYAFDGSPLYGSLGQHREFAEPFEQHFTLVSGTVGYDLGSAMVTSISSFQSARTHNFYDLSAEFVPELGSCCGGPFGAIGDPAFDITNKFTQEVRVGSHGPQPLEWLVGGFYTRESSRDDQSFALLSPSGQPITNDLFTTSSPSIFKEYAGFADLTYHIIEKFDVSGGVRYARNDQTYTQNGSGAFVGSEPTRSSSAGVFTYLANARYHFDADTTGYVRYATGYRPGGPNAVANNPVTGQPVAPPTFQADRLQSYEAGLKAESADRRFGIDVDGYFINWNDLQVFATSGGFSINANAGRATVRGSELTLTARPLEGWDFTGAFAYQNAQLAEASTDLGGAKGERLPNVPRFTSSLTSDYLIYSGGLRPTVGATMRYVTARMASFNESVADPQYRLPSYITFDVRTGIALDKVNLQLYVHNVANRLGELSAITGYGPAAQVAIIQPRTVGLSMSVSY